MVYITVWANAITLRYGSSKMFTISSETYCKATLKSRAPSLKFVTLVQVCCAYKSIIAVSIIMYSTKMTLKTGGKQVVHAVQVSTC